MENNTTKVEEVLHSVFKEATRLSEDALYCYAGHAEEARRWWRLHMILGIPTVIIAAFAGLTALSSESSSVAVFGSNSNIIAGILAFLVALMSGLNTFLDPKGLTSKHEQKSAEYFGLMTEARSFGNIDCLRTDNVENLSNKLKEIQDKMNELNKDILVISKGTLDSIYRRVKRGDFDYEVDEDEANKQKQ